VSRFKIDSETKRQYSRFNARGTELTLRLLPPTLEDNPDVITHFQGGVNDLFDYALRNVDDSHMEEVTIHNEVNILDKAIGISFRRKDQLFEEVIWSVFSKVAQSNARYNCCTFSEDACRFREKEYQIEGSTSRRYGTYEKSIIAVKSKTNCLAHALIIAIARLTKDRKYKSYLQGRRTILPVVQRS